MPSTLTGLPPQIATLIAATVGFGGVICTLFVNASFARRAERRRLLRDQETLRVGLQLELKNLIKSIKAEKEWAENNQSTWYSILDFFAIYRANLDKFGLLTTKEMELITYAYHTYIEYVGYIARIGRAAVVQTTLGTNLELTFKEKSERDRYLRNLDAMLPPARAAVKEIDQHLIGFR